MTPLWSVLSRIVLPGLLLGGLGYGLSLLYAAGVPLVVCLVAGQLLAAAWVLGREFPVEDIGDLALPATEPHQQRMALGDFTSWQNRLRSACGDQDRFEARLRPELRLLTAALLQRGHGVHWLAEPDRARAILGPELWRLLSAPSGTLHATPDRLERWVDEMERL
ncbi:hypothetical protein BH20ACT5_BH20ACT5_23120 [soil metagenome]